MLLYKVCAYFIHSSIIVYKVLTLLWVIYLSHTPNSFPCIREMLGVSVRLAGMPWSGLCPLYFPLRQHKA